MSTQPEFQIVRTNDSTEERDRLFLLNPNFTDSRHTPVGQMYYCPFNAMLEGVLRYYPQLREQLEVTYVDFPRPRKVLVDILGDEHQGTPVLVIQRRDVDLTSIQVHYHLGRSFIHGAAEIAEYLGRAYGIPLPHP